MLDKEIKIRFTLRQVICRAWMPPVMTAVVFGVFWWATYWKWDSIDWPAWVQAVGSLIGIVIAIAVPAWQWNRAASDRAAETTRLEHMNALTGHKACVEVDQFIFQLISRNSGDRHQWHDKEHFRVWGDSLQRRLAQLLEKETTAHWWLLFTSAQAHLMEIDSVLRIHDIDSPIVGLVAESVKDSWTNEVEPARQKLIQFEAEHPEFRPQGLWD